VYWQPKPDATFRSTRAPGSKCCNAVLAMGWPSARWPVRTTISPSTTEKLDYAIDRYVNETSRLYAVLVSGWRTVNSLREYSIATWPVSWIVPHEARNKV